MELSDQIQVVIQHLIKIPAFLSGLCQDHGKMEGNRSDIKPPHKYRLVLIICGMHASSLVPGGKKCPAAHGGDYLAVLLIHAGDIALSCEGKPVRVHRFGRTFYPGFKHILKLLSGAVKVFVI